jgi:plastocyanin
MPSSRSQSWISTLALAALALAAGCGGGQDKTSSAPAREPAAPAAAAAAPAGPLGTASITGSVRYEGEVPTMKRVKMEADPNCARKHDSPPQSEMLVLGDGNRLANVFVSVTGGLPGGSYPATEEPAVIDQQGCRYVPHVLGVMKGQTIKILNSDGLLHNVHALPKVNRVFNMAMPASRTETEVTFTEEEQAFKIKCDVHPWMGAYVQVLSHPFFDVTGEDGRFNLANLPAGSYEVTIWHERLGTETRTAEVADGQSLELDFTMSR